MGNLKTRLKEIWEKNKVSWIFVLVGIIVISFIIFNYWSLKNSVPNLPPEEMAEKVIRENVKDEFLPSEKDYIHKVVSHSEIVSKYQQGELSNFILPPFGSRIANLYLTDWVYENAYFNSYIAYDKETGDFIGYDISVRVKEPELKGPELAQKYFKNIPHDSFFNKWRHGSSQSEFFNNKSKVSTIVYYKEKANKVFLESEVTEYFNLTTVHWPKEDRVRKIGLVWMEVLTPLNPYYSGVEQLQKDVMAGYEEE